MDLASPDLAPPSTAVPTSPTTATVLDLFAGAGGLSQGFVQAGGFAAVEAVESDLAAAATFSLNHRSARVRALTIEEWLDAGAVPQVDVVVGGPPCQGFSALGKRDAEDVRNLLWREYAQTLVRSQPRYFVVENVPAFLKSRQFADLVEAASPGGLLEDYRLEARVLNAADFGAFQARKRAVVIGHHASLRAPGWPTAEFRSRHRTVREALRGVPGQWESLELPDRSFTFRDVELPGPYLTTELHVGRNYAPISLQRFSRIPPGGNRFDLPDELLAPCWRAHSKGSADVMGRLHWDKPAVTIRTEFFKPEKGRYLHPEANRAITHLEAALLQGFPTTYKWAGSRTAIARQIGNAVPIELGSAIAGVIRDALSDPAAPPAGLF